jgi:YD repeat-containing protein
MKKVRNFGLLAGLVMFFLVLGSCSPDDSDGGDRVTPVVNGKLLMMVRSIDNSYSFDPSVFPDSVLKCEYNSKDQIVQVNYGSKGWNPSLVYNDNKIIYDNSRYFILENGRVVRDSTKYDSGHNHKFEYDGEGQLTTIRGSSEPIATLTWQKGNIVTMVYGNRNYTFTYTSYSNTLPVMLSPIRKRDDIYGGEVVWAQGYFGKVCRNLPAKVTYSEGQSDTRTVTFDYTFTDGVPTKIVEQGAGSSNYTVIWELTWQ